MVTERPLVVESYFLLTLPLSAYNMSTTAATRFGQCLRYDICCKLVTSELTLRSK